MLKRTMGLFLLAFLVITGLAGTFKSDAVNKQERKKAISLMKETKADLLASVKGLSQEQAGFKAAPEKWSVTECVYHIAGAEKMLWGMLEGAMKSPANPDKRSEIKVTDDQLIKMIEDRSVKAQAPEPMQPKNTGFKSLEEALADFKSNRAAHIKYMKSTTEDLRNHVVQMPFGWIDCYQFYLFIAAHSNRHTQQLNEVKANEKFPK